ncbi:NUDIX hydrolase [Gilvimarinus sp. SDUM040013]|uniref:GDP-mannose pyrophosphatase n=1 Tax=Gilvimarinus gilvus TaxID=3058038 RepID=A0ABU4S436_9GAMM|nr:NUDIX hydrolase [Gilvimarinus sp. SDUM040013]MDO3384590.1 NUDIX hydrolase [Gilvimarinus sp. SDUM040013]MDX6850074.1 NUDIX hydrolase [Gilvimarinus sp. SDUM040013]
MGKIRQLSSREVYKNYWMRVREDDIERPSGAKGIYGVVEKPDFAVIAAIEDGYIYLVQQYRYTVGGRYWEMPQGAWEQNPDAPAKELAAGELKEETGLTAEHLTHLGYQYLAYGFCTQGYHIFLAQGLTSGDRQLDAEEEDLIAERFALSEVKRMILAGEIKDATTVNAFGWLQLTGHLGNL